ncbi:1-phosphatidylinositol 4,5-bisphosphate phosphodiesterase delta-3-A-like [Corythoichthys intestinalis]|uniref:1-phosphatidylinositol 4,5-bisphosphate phosphodiesterase delta-3-A-like n=1 Tax=Corythoichthys intestinalis TaxID=161448 RepID=UPI0025A58B22|nr:1-phosphatidylinositol 4,5-bisphosphate phosphodiesterase delta-3-A-like [Corythoichthys intestinalis]
MFRNRGKAAPARKNGNGTSDSKAIHPLRSLGLQDDDDVQWMLKGSNMVKIRSPHWQKRRTLKLLEDGVTIWCQSRKTFSRAKARQSFSIAEVECVCAGCHSETLRQIIGADPEGRCLTVVFKGPRKNLDLLCQSHEDAFHWTRGIQTLQERIDNMTQKEKLDHWIQAYLSRADQNHDDKMSYDEVQLLLQMINIDLNDQYARELFQKCDHSADGRLEHKEIELFCRELLRRPELDAVFMHYSSNGCVLSATDLRDFLNDQAEDSSFTHAQSLIITYELNEWAQRNHLMTPNGFTMYMLSKENSVFNLDHARVYQDMKRPLTHYFISSSHNTYLTKDQLTGESGIEPYIRALNHGCRCVELDCWDGDNGQPVIYHGYTLTSKVPFVEVIKTINEYAFKASPYPLILSLENHCSVEQQAVMARHLQSILGDKLLTKPIPGLKCDNLPSPEDLKGKILVKGKKENTAEECCACTSNLNSSEETAASKLSPELSELVVYTCSVHFKSFQHSAKAPPSHMSSFSESEALRHVKDSGMYFVRHNSHHLSRIYPSGQRLQSSNYNPQEMWNAGCHLVALNFQTPGEEMDINRGRFLQNGQCGYILKPPFMCQPDTTFNPENVGGGPGHVPVLLTVRVISAQQLPKQERTKPTAIVDPHVWVEIHGVPIDNDRKKTHHIQNNGFNPQWDYTFNFTIHAPSLALVRFVVEDHDYASSNDFLGQYTLPFTSLRTGYRHVRLLKQDGSSLSPSSLFIHIKLVNCENSTYKSSKSPAKVSQANKTQTGSDRIQASH